MQAPRLVLCWVRVEEQLAPTGGRYYQDPRIRLRDRRATLAGLGTEFATLPSSFVYLNIALIRPGKGKAEALTRERSCLELTER